MDGLHLPPDLCTSGARRNLEVGSLCFPVACAFSFYCNDPQKNVAGKAVPSTFSPQNTISPFAVDRCGILVRVYLQRSHNLGLTPVGTVYRRFLSGGGCS
jgi:hypothetical protein